MQRTDFTVKWADGSRHKVDAEKAYQVTSDLEERGELTAQNLVDVSRPADAILHDEFEWDDDVAANQYRLTQARSIIRHIQIVRTETGEEEKVFVNVRVERPEYTTIRKALMIPDERELLLRAAKRDMEAFRAKYEKLIELDAVMNAISLYLEDDRSAEYVSAQ